MTFVLERGNDYAQWWAAATNALARSIAPHQLVWEIGGTQQDLFAAAPESNARAAPAVVPISSLEPFVKIARRVICHRAPARHAVLYRLLWRLQDDHALLDRLDDPDVQQLNLWHAQVRRAAHKMKAFVRFRRQPDGHFVAWFDPGHPLLEAMTPFFVGRFAAMRWLIVTPERSCAWDGSRVHFGPGAPRSAQPAADPCEALWRTYYAHIFNPARLMPAAMRREMPVRYWRDLPEARLIGPLIRSAEVRTLTMIRDAGAAHRVRERALACLTLPELNAAVRGCTLCPAGCLGTRAVAGVGPVSAAVMLVGEQPGDLDEQAGIPFAGPAGQVLDELLSAASLPREQLYVTNTVKHFGFRYQLRGKKRLHQSPSTSTVEHCLPWLQRERELVQPQIIIALGKTAGKALAQPATFHPAYLLREPDPERRQAAWNHVLMTLQTAAAATGAAGQRAASANADKNIQTDTTVVTHGVS